MTMSHAVQSRLGASVVICTWNRASLLDRTLTSLQKLRIPRDVEWELLIVDNNSTDHTPKIIRKHSMHLPIVPLFEPRTGKSFAANQAVSRAKGELILWIDDDVMVSDNWMEEYLRAAKEWPDAAFFGGTVDPLFESEPPEWIRKHLVVRGPYAVNQLGREIRPFLPGESPLGANMALRKEVAAGFPFNVQLGTFEGRYLPGEDGELFLRLRNGGYRGVWVGTAVVKHVIPGSRLTGKYISDWYRGHGRTMVLREGIVGKSLFGAPLWAIRKFLESKVKAAALPVRNGRWVEACVNAARMRGVIEEALKQRSIPAAPNSRMHPRSGFARFRAGLPWRVQQSLERSTYIRFLTRKIFRLVRHTPAVAADPESRIDVLSLLDHANVDNYLLSIKSLLLHAPVLPAVTVLSDGTLRPDDIENLKRHIPSIRILQKEEVPIPRSHSTLIDRWCRQYAYLAKLMYLPFASGRKFIMILDSDVIFRAPLPSTFMELPPDYAANYNCDHDHSRHDPHFCDLEEYAAAHHIDLIKNLNCGLMVWERERVRPLDCIEFLDFTVRRHGFLHAVAEQDAWTLLASQVRALPLSERFLVLSNWPFNRRPYRRQALAVHYVSGERYRRLDYLRDGWRIIQMLRQGRKKPKACAWEEPRSNPCIS